jgi:outer membrane protein OmpA-like peptidoglycan-associated protein/inosine/xanthosine triphosphate pyrophosphatase family protein
MVKNIINANLVSAAKLKKRDDTIDEKQLTINEQQKDVDELAHQVTDREGEIKANNAKISDIQDKLAKQINEVKYAYRSKKNAQDKAEAEIARLTQDSQKQINALQSANGQYMNQLQDAQSKIAAKNRESEKLLAELNETEAQYQQSIGELNRAHQDALEKEKRGFEEGMRQANLSAEGKLAKQKAYADGIERQNKLYSDKLKGLEGDLDRTKKSISDMQGKYQGSIAALQKANGALAGDLAATQAKLNAQKELADGIAKNLAKAGISANVDGKTGDVTINFQDEYFDTGSANLKNGMRSILEKAIPAYAQSLFKDPKIASKISSVEIVGFASPTYKGKTVDPSSLDPNDRQAVNFNMDLSYQRAKSIFEYTFDTNRMTFPHQQELLPLVKVSGRSYLATDKLTGRTPAGTTNDEYCAKFDCKKTQRVIIRFNLKEQ